MWESHADSDVRRLSKPGPDRALPKYMVCDSGCRTEDRMVAAVTTSQSTPDQLETASTAASWSGPPPKLEPSTVEQRLLAGAQARKKPAPAVTTGISDIESLLQSLLPDATRLDYGGVFLVQQSGPLCEPVSGLK